MADQVGDAVLRISLDEASAKKVFSALDELVKKNKDTADSARGIGQAINLKIFEDLGRFGLEAVKKIGEGIIWLGERGADVDDVSNSFGVLTRQAGSTADAMLGQLRAGVVGTINDFDLMRQANVALGAGLVHNADDMGTLAAGARVLAKATGDSTAGAFEKLTDAMAKGRVAGLKTMGLFVDSKGAVLAYAAAHHTTVAALTEEEKATAVGAAALAALRERLKAIPPDAADFGEKIKQVKVQLENMRDQVAVQISQSPVFAAAMDAGGKALTSAFGNDQKANVTKVTQLIEQVAIVAVKGAGLMVEAARFITNGWFGLQVMFNGVAGGITQNLGMIVGAIASTIEAASKIPVIGDQYKAAAVGVRSIATDLKNLSGGFYKNANDALDSAATINRGFDVAKASVDTIVSAMEAALGAARVSAETTKQAIAGIGNETGATAQKTKDHAKEIAEVFKKLSQDIVLDTKEGLDKRLQVIENEKQNELQKARELTGGVGAAYEQMVQLITQRAAQRVAVEKAAGDEIKNHELQLQQEISLAHTTGMQRELMEVQQKEAAELQSIERLRITRAADFEQLSQLIHQKYADQTATIRAHYTSVEEMARAAGFKTRAELEESARKAKETYAQMLASGKFTYEELRKAHEASMNAQQAVEGKVAMTRKEQLNLLYTSTLSVLQSIFGKSKALAIASTIIETIASAVAAFHKAGGFPWGIAPAAASLAFGYAKVAEIRAQSPGFFAGTPGLDFSNFGTSTVSVLHGQEAVIPRGKGHMLAGEIAAAMPGGGGSDGELTGLVRTQIALMQDLPRQIGRAVRNGMLLST